MICTLEEKMFYVVSSTNTLENLETVFYVNLNVKYFSYLVLL